MKVIDYFDYINKKWIKVKVKNKVAEYLQQSDKNIRRSNNFFRWKIAHSLDEIISKNGEGNLTFEEILADKNLPINYSCHDDNYRIILKHAISKLNDLEKRIVIALYTINCKSFEIAKLLNISASKFIRIKNNAMNHLRKILIDSIEFKKTKYCKQNYFN